MNPAPTSLDLSSFCRTKSQARDFMAKLATLSEKAYQTDFHFETALIGIFGMQQKDAFLTLIRESGVPMNKPADLKNFLASLQKQIAALPVLSIVLAFEPTDVTLKILSDWFLLNNKRQILFDVSVDKELIAGIAIKFNGRYAEYSIKPAVEKLIADTLTKAANPRPAQPPQQQPATQHHSIESMSLGR